jgi:LDH2 family malate/lactate/ureidoglycolate dehydrogenase
MSFTNTSPFLSPTRSKGAALGTNPITVAAKGLDQDRFVLDMATTAVAVGKVISHYVSYNDLRPKIGYSI